jgi:L-rhamnose mutarotase
VIRNAFTMKLKKGCEAEYKKRHDEIWPELGALLKKAGISDYSIFLDEDTGILFAVQKLADDNTAGSLPGKEIMDRWWDYMADIMDVNSDNSPVCTPLGEVFHMD